MKELEEILAALELSAEEVAIYVHLLEHGGQTAGVLAKKLSVARPTLYGILQRMTQKGVIVRSLRRGVRTFIAEDPLVIVNLLQQRIEGLQTKQLQYRELLPRLQNMRSQIYEKPKVEVFEGYDAIQNIKQDVLMHYDTEIVTLWPIATMIDLLSPEFFRWHNKERIRNNLSMRVIWPANEVVALKDHPYMGSGEAFKREIRVAPAAIDISMGYWIYANRIMFLSSHKEAFGCIIESAEMAKTLKAQWHVLWDISQPLPTNPNDTAQFEQELKRYLL